VNKLRVAGVLTEPVNAYFENIFETGVDEMSWDDLSKNDMLWPSVREVTEYRRTVYQLVKNVILGHPCLGTAPITWVRAKRNPSATDIPCDQCFSHDVAAEHGSVLLDRIRQHGHCSCPLSMRTSTPRHPLSSCGSYPLTVSGGRNG